MNFHRRFHVRQRRLAVEAGAGGSGEVGRTSRVAIAARAGGWEALNGSRRRRARRPECRSGHAEDNDREQGAGGARAALDATLDASAEG